MAEEFNKKILIDVQAKTETLKENAVKLNVELDNMKAKLKEVETASTKNSVAYQEQASKVRLTQDAIRANNKELDNASKALVSNTNSITQNRALLATLTAEHIKLQQTEGASSIKAKEMEATLLKVTETLKAQTSAYGDNRMFVGGYTEALDKMKAAQATADSGLNKLTGSLYKTVGGFGFMPGPVGNVVSTFQGVYNASANVVTGFMRQNEVAEALVVANQQLSTANYESATAAKANAVAQEQLAANEITEAEAAAVATAAKEKEIAATEAQTIATAASTAATQASTAGLKLLRVALASTGVGLLVLALGALYSYFTTTNEGAKKFAVILKTIGAVVQVGIKAFGDFGKSVYDAITHPIDSLKALGQMIIDNVINRFKAVSVILDGIIHLDFKKISDGVIQSFSGVEHATDKIAKIGNGIADFAKKARDAGAAAAEITKERQKLGKEERLWSEEKLKQQGILDVLKLKMRDQGIAEKERVKIAEQAKKLSDEIFTKDLEHATKNAQLVQREQDLLSKKDFQAVTDAKNRVQQLKNTHEQEIQSIQNRESRVEKTLDRMAAKEESIHEKMAKALAEADNIKAQSLTRLLQATYDAYGNEVLAADQHYQDELTKLKKLQAEKLITISKFNQVQRQLEAEHRQNIEKIVEKFNKEDAAEVLKAQRELTDLYQQAIENDTEKQLSALKAQTSVKLQLLDTEADEIYRHTQQQLKEINDLRGAGRLTEAAEAQRAYDSNLKLLEINGKKRTEVVKQNVANMAKVNKAAEEQRIASENEAVVIYTDKKGMEKEHLAAVKKQINDEYTLKINAELALGHDVSALRAERRQKEEAAETEYNEKMAAKRAEIASRSEQLIQNTASTIIANGIASRAQERLNALSKEKAAELNNTSLTNSQKNIIEEKYKKKENAEKVKEFKANQKLAIGQALINGALAATKTVSNLGFPWAIPFLALTVAETAASVIAITSQKPPSYSGGGLHYQSDGRGTLLSGPGTGTSDSMNAYVSNGEAIINARSVQKHRSLLSAINVDGGGRPFDAPGLSLGRSFTGLPSFAGGGTFTSPGTYLPSSDNGLRPAPVYVSTASDFNYDKLIDGFSDATVNAISNMPKPVVDVKDIAYQQSILAKVEDRSQNL